MWNDSQVPLTRFTNLQEVKHFYVADRVAGVQILRSKADFTFNHISSKENPTDLLTQGCTVEPLKKSIWEHGPECLPNAIYLPFNPIPVFTKVVVEINLIPSVEPHVETYLDLVCLLKLEG